MGLADARKREVFAENIERTEILLFDANVNKMVAEKCGQADKMKKAILRIEELERCLVALKELADDMLEQPAPKSAAPDA